MIGVGAQERPEWFGPLAEAVADAADSPDELAAVFERLRTDVGADEAGRRWWAVFAESDATHT